MSQLHFQSNYSLLNNNTLAVQSHAELFCEPSNNEQVREAVEFAKANKKAIQVLGGGSNVLLPSQVSGLIVHPISEGIEVTSQGNTSLVRVAAGENWHNLVEKTLAQGLCGLENLALIPGNVGAAPIQNIGAYGVELKDVFHSLEAIHLQTGEQVTMTNTDCQFSYRDSVFKQSLRNQLLITSVTLQLHQTPQVNVQYPALTNALEGCSEISPQLVAKKVIELRQSKLPDPNVLPNVGSFFKNPIISEQQLAIIKKDYPQLVSYSLSDGLVKLAAAWLIDKAGWKGKRLGPVMVHSQQALVLVNDQQGRVDDVLNLAELIKQDVKNKFGVSLEVEPQKFLS